MLIICTSVHNDIVFLQYFYHYKMNVDVDIRMISNTYLISTLNMYIPRLYAERRGREGNVRGLPHVPC